MTITELQNKFADKDRRISEMAEKIKAVENEIACLDRQKQTSVQNGTPDQAIQLMRTRRDKEDELQILCQVRDSIKAEPAVSQRDISKVWDGVCNKVMTEFEGEALPELQEAYTRYRQAVEALVALRQKAHTAASQLDNMERAEGLYSSIRNPFIGIEPLANYYPNRAILEKLNCLNGVDVQITRPFNPQLKG